MKKKSIKKLPGREFKRLVRLADTTELSFPSGMTFCSAM